MTRIRSIGTQFTPRRSIHANDWRLLHFTVVLLQLFRFQECGCCEGRCRRAVYHSKDVDVVQNVTLPTLPDNCQYLHHPNECYDWGTFGWVIQERDIKVEAYQYFVFLNSSVRGPFLPAYLQVWSLTWIFFAAGQVRLCHTVLTWLIVDA